MLETFVPTENTLLTDDGFRWITFSPDHTLFKLVCLEDLQTGITVATPLNNPNFPAAATMAWSGARESRSAGTPWEILSELAGVNVDKKVEDIVSYGHKSVGDMAGVVIKTVNAPMHYFLTSFYLGSVYSGQEKSTRFQKAFGKSSLPDINLYLPSEIEVSLKEKEKLNQAYLAVEQTSRDLFAKWKDKLTGAFGDFFQPDPENSKHKAALEARVLDCARKFLLLGIPAGQHFDDWVSDLSTNIIPKFKASPLKAYQRYGLQLQRLLTPTPAEEEILGFKAECPSLIRHTDAASTVPQNLARLEEYLYKTDLLEQIDPPTHVPQRHDIDVSLIDKRYGSDMRMVAQYILSIWPGLECSQILAWLDSQDTITLKEISSLIFAGHNNYVALDNLAQTTDLTLQIDDNLAVARDLNRHRPWGRFMEMMKPFLYSRGGVLEILGRGFTIPKYLTEISEFSDLAQEYDQDMLVLFGNISDFIGQLFEVYGDKTDLSPVLNLLPLGLHTEQFMHGNPLQAKYMPEQRVRPGGDMDYTQLAWDMNCVIAQSSPILAGIEISSQSNLSSQGIDLSVRPDPADRQRFFNRG
jgi:hypothetical protein